MSGVPNWQTNRQKSIKSKKLSFLIDLIGFPGSRPAQLAIHTVFDEESESEFKRSSTFRAKTENMRKCFILQILKS